MLDNTTLRRHPVICETLKPVCDLVLEFIDLKICCGIFLKYMFRFLLVNVLFSLDPSQVSNYRPVFIKLRI